MKILSIDTSSSVCSVALLEDNKIIKEVYNTNEREHSETLMPMIDDTFKLLNMTLDDIDLIACTKGPGSFTGIRIGISTVKAFADAKNIPIVGVNSLEALAYTGIMKKGNGEYVSIIDARNDNVYFGIYKMKNGKFSIYKSPDVVNITEMTKYIDNLQLPVYFIGNINVEKIEPLYLAQVSTYRANSQEIYGHEYLTNLPTMAVGAGLAALDKYNMEIYGDSNSISPLYLRKPQAQRQREGISDDIAILEMGCTDLENIKLNYEDFPNIWEYRVLEEDYRNSKYFIIKQNEDICGFIGIRIVFEEMEIMNIVTRADKRNQGVASNLLSYILKYANMNSIERINLEVNENNKKAINLYKTFGFEQVGKRNKYYNNENAILMTAYI